MTLFYYLLCASVGFFLGVVTTMWTLHRIGRRMLRKQKEAWAKERTRQIIAKAYYDQYYNELIKN